MSNNKPVYIVSGYKRSGTSMMMKCLEAGGMRARYNTTKDVALSDKYSREGYHPNPEGFYELGRKEFDDPGFPHIYSGELIKVLHWRLAGLPEYRYNIVFMLRDPKEIEVSYLKMFRHRPPFILQKYNEEMQKIIDAADNRNDITIIPVQHRDMITNPESVMTLLMEKGWPVASPGRAAGAVNRNLYRSQASDLDGVRKSIPGLRTDLPKGFGK